MSAALARLGTIRAAVRRAPAALALAEAMKRPAKAKRPSAPLLASSWPIVDAIRIALPIAPSVNGIYFNSARGGRSRTAAYNAWKKAAGWIVATSKPGRVVGPFTFALYLPEKMQGDVDGRTKAALDLFVSLGVTDDDRHCRRAIAEKSGAVPKGECLCVIRLADVNPACDGGPRATGISDLHTSTGEKSRQHLQSSDADRRGKL